MSLLLLPFEVIIENVVHWLPIPAVAAVAAVAPFANFGAPEFAAAVREAVEHARRQFAPLVQHGLNVPVFEHRRWPVLFVVSSPATADLHTHLVGLVGSLVGLSVAARVNAFDDFLEEAGVFVSVSFVVFASVCF